MTLDQYSSFECDKSFTATLVCESNFPCDSSSSGGDSGGDSGGGDSGGGDTDDPNDPDEPVVVTPTSSYTEPKCSPDNFFTGRINENAEQESWAVPFEFY
jgi:hypothetical protein